MMGQAALVNRQGSNVKEQHGWQIIYLGANQDAFAVGGSIGCHLNANYAYTKSGMQDSVQQCSRTVQQSKMTGSKITSL